MPYFQYEQQSIDELNREIGPEHPLYRKRLYVTAVRRDPTAVIFETVAEKSIYALVYLTYSGKRGKRNPKTRIIPSREDLGAFIQKEHDDWIEECSVASASVCGSKISVRRVMEVFKAKRLDASEGH